MTSPQQLLWSLRAAGVIDAVDAHVALRLGRRARLEDAEVFAALALAVRAPRHGHVCVDLATADLAHLRPPDAEGEAPTLPEDRATWAAAVGDAAVVRRSTTSPRLPFHLEGTQLYTDRYWTYQQQVATRLQELSTRPLRTPGDPQRLQAALHRLFRPADQASKPALNRQQLAAASASLRDLTVITGGPGMGKTWTVRNLLALALLDHPPDAPPMHIALAAPSGKAAVRMREALHEDLHSTLLPTLTELAGPAKAQAITQHIEQLRATTLHRLLGWQPSSPSRFEHNQAHPLRHDLVIIDECSMIDLAMMAKLLDAIGPQTRLVLLGDPHQLASVEAGTVLADICGHVPAGLPCASPALVQALEENTGLDLGEDLLSVPELGLQDSIVRFNKNYRFSLQSPIGRFATACLSVPIDVPGALALIETNPDPSAGEPLTRRDHTEGALSTPALDGITGRYAPMLEALSRGPEGADEEVFHRRLLDALAEHRVLCAHRRGPLGAGPINAQLAKRLGPKADRKSAHWHGQPILVVENSPAVGRANGDVGMVVMRSGVWMAAFPGSDSLPTAGSTQTSEELKLVEYLSLARLPSHETCYAMTIHKAQGSQWNHVTIVLPDKPSPILTRELVYTAVTRARETVTILSPESVLTHALQTPIRRASGLAPALAAQASQ